MIELDESISVYFGIDGPLLIYLCVILIIAAVTDFISQKIPNLLTFSTMLIGVVYHANVHGLQGFFSSLAGLAAGMGVLIIFYIMGGMGAGDVKLMGAVGAVLGAKGAFLSFLLTAFFGGIYSLLVILMNRRIFKGFFRDIYTSFLTLLLTKKFDPVPVRQHEDKPRLCYGVAIALGTITYVGLVLLGYENVL